MAQVRSRTITRDQELKKLVKRTKAAQEQRVAIGILRGASEGSRAGIDEGAPKFTPIATYMAIHEFGTSKLPSKPWFRSALTVYEPKYNRHLREGMVRILTGRASPRGVLTELGIMVQGDLRVSITKFGLVDTGAARNAVAFQVFKGGRGFKVLDVRATG